ncbi:hypothetical protein [Marinobacter sp. F3R08]|uniref:hypothetical protein n=1 Tax=Marinobacter sp. F3R08 TaxID=2841559 RepID=UPI001C0943C3|nr:hypothetical protein [Marinobacter sp. F3R08]MBU2952203.1 hypothetical protein [Marinobacter sp. F3R08]
MNLLALTLRTPSTKELVGIGVFLTAVALIFTGLHFSLDVSSIALRKAFFVVSSSMMLGSVGISLVQNGWRVLPIYMLVTGFAIFAL